MGPPSIPVNDKPPRKFPAPCWAQDETLALISAYRDRWYSLRRGFLRTADWASVAEAVAAAFPADPAKTPAQCRHKIEKLRQRYRAEKQKSLSPPLSSSWYFFRAMDSMENGVSISAVGSDSSCLPNPQGNNNYSSMFRIKSVGDQNLVEPIIKRKNSKMGFGPNSENLAIRGKNSGIIENSYGNPSIDEGSDGEDVGLPNFRSGVRFGIPFEEKVVNPVFRAKKLRKVKGDYGANQYHVNGYGEDFPPWLRAKGKMNMNPHFFYGDVNLRAGSSVSCEMNTDVWNGVPSSGYGSGKKSVGREVKREREAVDEIVSAIKFLGEGFISMEKMKMDMAREMEKTRMEMELKHNELIVKSQREIIDAFVSALLENNSNKKQKKSPTTVAPEL